MQAVEQQLAHLGEVVTHNFAQVSNGFTNNDIWLETFKRALSDVGATLKSLCASAGVVPDFRVDATTGKLDWNHYWAEALDAVELSREQAMKKQARAEDAAPLVQEAQSVLSALGDDSTIEFGGDYAANQAAAS